MDPEVVKEKLYRVSDEVVEEDDETTDEDSQMERQFKNEAPKSKEVVAKKVVEVVKAVNVHRL